MNLEYHFGSIIIDTRWCEKPPDSVQVLRADQHHETFNLLIDILLLSSYEAESWVIL